MNAETWATVGTILATILLFIVPTLIYTWYALEHLIGDRNSYAPAIAISTARPWTDPAQRNAISFAKVELVARPGVEGEKPLTSPIALANERG